MIYLDHSATTPVDQVVLNKMLPYFSENFGNASSLYALGQKNKQALNEARNKVAKVLNCLPSEIIFTSGGSESDNLAIKGVADSYVLKNNAPGHLITTSFEHKAVLDSFEYLKKQGWEITIIEPNSEGIVQLEAIKKIVKDNTVLVSLMYVNNEIGTVQPINKIGEWLQEKGIMFHTDAVQAAAYLNLDAKKLNIDLMSLSAHKFYGPKGVGILYAREGVQFTRQQDGGGHEFKKRAGTENIPGIVGLAEALSIADRDKEKNNNKITELRDYLQAELLAKIKDSQVNGNLNERIASNLHLSIKGIEGEAMLAYLDLE